MIFKTLSSQIQTELNESIYINKFYLDKQWNFIEAKIIKWSKNPIKQSIKFALFYLFIFIIICNLDALKYAIPPFNLNWIKIVNFKDVIFNGQLTILALIFPLVIGFVGILIKDDIANKSLWRIYSRYSGFMLVGFSGLALIISMLLMNLFIPLVIGNIEVSLIVVFCIWFIFNLTLVGWLLYSTFNFIQIDKQNSILIKYTINVVVITEIKKRLYSLIPKVAKNFNLIPSDDTTLNNKITFYKFEKNDSDIIKRNFKQKMYLKDINYTLLSFAIMSYKFRNKYFLIRKDIDLTLEVTGSGFPHKEYILGRLNKYNFTYLEKILIKLAYSFTSINKFEEDDIKNIVNVLFNNIDNTIRQNNQRAFSDSVDNLQEFIKDIFAVTSFINDKKKIDNWLLLTDGSFFSSKLLNEFMNEFYSLNLTIIEKTIESDHYFRDFCYFYQYTYNYDGVKLHNDIQKELLQGHYHLWVELVKNDILKTKLYFDSLCMKYIGGWESWTNRRDRDITTWDNASYNVINLTNHMQYSCSMVITAIKYENNNASIWATNLLNNWANNYDVNKGSYQYLWKTEILNSSIFKENENSDIVKFITNDEVTVDDVYNISLKNTFIQSRIITASYILNKNVNTINDIDRQIIFALINKDIITPDTTHKMTFNYQDIQQILETFILNDNSFWQIVKNTTARNLIKEFNNINDDEHISGRVYSTMGREDISQMKDSFSILLICHSKTQFNLSQGIYDFIFSDLFPQSNREDLIRVLKEFITINEDSIKKVKKLLSLDNIDSFIEKYNVSINKIIKHIEDKNNEMVLSRDISKDRLQSLKTYCSKSAFKKDSAGFPLKLFNNINYVSDLDIKYKNEINLNGINKRELLNDTQLSVNEDYFFDDILETQVYINLFRRIFNDISYIDKEFSDKTELIVSIINDNLVDDNMIIFIGDSDIYSFLHSLSWSKEIEVPFSISFNDGFKDDYICHINDIPIFSIKRFDIDFCLLVNKSVFEEINIKESSKDIFVDIEFKENKEDLSNCSLLVSYFMQTTFNKKLTNYKYTYNKTSKHK